MTLPYGDCVLLTVGPATSPTVVSPSNPIPVSNSPGSLTASGTGGALNDTPIPATDVSAYRWVCVQTSGTFSASFAFEASNDGTTWYPCAFQEPNRATGSWLSNTNNAAALDNLPITTKYFRTRITAYTSGTVTQTAQFSATPVMMTGLGVDTELPSAATLADGASNPTAPAVAANGTLYNGSTWDRRRGNTDATLLISAARTSSNNSSDQTNYNGKGLHLVIDVTAVSGSPSLTFTIQGKDSVSGKYYTILASTALTGTGTTVLKVHPGLTAAANSVANDLLPRTWRVSVTAGTADSVTYSVGASIIV